MDKRLITILDECLDRLLQGESIEQCLASYPDRAGELEPLLRAAFAVKQAVTVKPRPEYREKVRREFLSALPREPAVPIRRTLAWPTRWAVVALSIVILLLGGGGTVAMARNSLPGDPLYRVKLAAEDIQVSITPSKLAKAELYARLADERVKEIVQVVSKGRPEPIEEAAELLNSHLAEVANLTAQGASSAGAMAVPPPPTTAAPAPVQPALSAPKVASAPTPAPSITVVPTIPVPAAAPPRVSEGASDKGKSSQEARTDAKQDKGNGASESSEKRTKLKEAVDNSARANPEALREALEKAPPSVRWALMRAIAVADNGYREALEKLD